jgi:hypothetical protein
MRMINTLLSCCYEWHGKIMENFWLNSGPNSKKNLSGGKKWLPKIYFPG